MGQVNGLVLVSGLAESLGVAKTMRTMGVAIGPTETLGVALLPTVLSLGVESGLACSLTMIDYREEQSQKKKTR